MKTFKPGDICITSSRYPGKSFIFLILKQTRFETKQVYNVLILTGNWRFKVGVLYPDEIEHLCT